VLPVNRARIGYTDRGDGPAMLLIHAGVSSEWFAPIADDPMLDGFRVIRIIRAGYTPVPHRSGMSRRPTTRHTARRCWTPCASTTLAHS
jgi:hypothetical protein